MKDELTYHVPVLLMPSVDGMNIRPDGTYVDVTFGGGGHSREILSRLGDGGRLLGFDQDEDAERNIVNNPAFYICTQQLPLSAQLPALSRHRKSGCNTCRPRRIFPSLR